MSTDAEARQSASSTVTVRPLTDADIPGTVQVRYHAFAEHDRRMGDPVPELTDEIRFWHERRTSHLLERDPEGAWVADDGDTIVGLALALRRGELWGLSLLVVDPARQSGGVGRRLLDASLTYAAGAQRAVILSSRDPRAIRSYATSGLDLHPQMRAKGALDPALLPDADPRVREGSESDRTLMDDVAVAVRGVPYGSDLEFMIGRSESFVVDDEAGRGYVFVRSSGDVVSLLATNEATAQALLWRGLEYAATTAGRAEVENLNAEQQWAIRVVLAARLRVEPGGPVFWHGATPPPCYLPTGAFF